jgi:hypothetical protein
MIRRTPGANFPEYICMADKIFIYGPSFIVSHMIYIYIYNMHICVKLCYNELEAVTLGTFLNILSDHTATLSGFQKSLLDLLDVGVNSRFDLFICQIVELQIYHNCKSLELR